MLPELVSTDVQGYKSVSYVNVVPVLVEAIKQQQGQLLAQQKQIDELKAINSENSELKALVALLADAVRRLQNERK